MNWRSIKIGDFLHRIRIPVDIEDDQDYNLVTIRMHHKGVALRGTKRGKDIGTKRMYRVAPGHFILSGIDARHGAFGIVPEELDGAVVTNDFWYFEVDEKQVDKELFLHLTSTSFFDDLCRIASDGTTNRVRLQADKFFNYEINLPAVKDQRELMAQLKHTNAAVATVLDETDQQLTHLTHLRQALLREAMQGQLLPQDPTDEPAALLLKKLQAAKAATGKGGKGKAGALFAEEAEAVEGLFDIPASWVWYALEDIATLITDGTHQTPSYTEQGRPFLSAQNIKPFRFMPEIHRYVSEEAYQEYTKIKKPELGDLLIARVGAGIGECAVIDKQIDFAFYVSLGLVKLVPGFLSADYLAYMINGPFGVAYSKNNIASKGGSAGNFNLTKIRTFPIPLPPLAEQYRIVAKLEQLMQHCDALEQRIRESRQLAELLLQTALREALAPSAGTEEATEEITTEPGPSTHRRGAQLALTDLFE